MIFVFLKVRVGLIDLSIESIKIFVILMREGPDRQVLHSKPMNCHLDFLVDLHRPLDSGKQLISLTATTWAANLTRGFWNLFEGILVDQGSEIRCR